MNMINSIPKYTFLSVLFVLTGCYSGVYTLPSENGSCIINKKGKLILATNYLIFDFKQGVACFYDSTNKTFGIIKENGKILYRSESPLGDYYDNLSCCYRNDSLLFFDIKGNIKIRPMYNGVKLDGGINYKFSYFSEGYAIMAYMVNDTATRPLYINKKGKVFFENRFLSASNFSNGMASVMFLDSTCGYINRKGKVKIVLPKGWYGDSFYEGLAWVEENEWKKDGSNNYLINKRGKRVCDTMYVYPEPFQNGRAKITKVRNGNHFYGYVNRKGKVVIESQYRWCTNFSDGLASVQPPSSIPWNFETRIINKKGETVLGPFKNIVILEFKKGVAYGYTSDNKDSLTHHFLINKKGKILYRSETKNILYSPRNP